MRRFWLLLSIVVLLAACSSAPPTTARKGSSYASGRTYSTRPPGFPDFVDHSIGREEIPIQAMGLVGIPYRWGGNTPDSGFDCSGLVRYVLARSADVNLPRTTAEMSSRGESIEPDQIAAGDLVFFNTTGRPHSHVGIYVGKLRFVNAPSTGGTVRLDYLTNPYWAKRFDGIRRVAPARHVPTPFDAPTWEASAPAATGASVAQSAPVAPTAPGTPAIQTTPASPAAPADRFAAATPPSSAGTAPAPATAPPPDAFEPPPQAMTTAQRQALAAGAVSPPVEPAPAPVPAAANAAPDPIDAAADAFEPPPPTSVAARQAAQAQTQQIPVARASAPADAAPSSSGPAQVTRASTAPHGVPAPTQPGDDPIARFANSAF